jgi:hypothetical protein
MWERRSLTTVGASTAFKQGYLYLFIGKKNIAKVLLVIFISIVSDLINVLPGKAPYTQTTLEQRGYVIRF